MSLAPSHGSPFRHVSADLRSTALVRHIFENEMVANGESDQTGAIRMAPSDRPGTRGPGPGSGLGSEFGIRSGHWELEVRG